MSWRPSCSLTALEARATMLRSVREFFFERDVLEVQTALVAEYGVSEPYIDSYRVPGFGYLQTSPEYQLKRLLAAGAPSLYHIAPAFRVGEAGRLHNPEFQMLEWYRLGFDAQALMQEVKELIDRVLGVGPCRELTYAELLEGAPCNLERESEDLFASRALRELGPGRLFVVDYPAEQAALARLKPDDPTVAARFELIVNGVELANGYHELTDPEVLRQRFVQDNVARERLQKTSVVADEKLLAAMRAGLPECAGVALGLDRLLMLALGEDDLQSVIAFPTGVA